MVAALVLPMPGGPLINTALRGPSLPLACAGAPGPKVAGHARSQARRSATSLPLPMSCDASRGLCFSTHRDAGTAAPAALAARGGARGVGAATGAGAAAGGAGRDAVAAATSASRPFSSISGVFSAFALAYLDGPHEWPTWGGCVEGRGWMDDGWCEVCEVSERKNDSLSTVRD